MVLPTNFKSRKVYRGINLIVLAMSGYSSPYWVTFNQARELGGKVQAGEKGAQIIFWKFLRSLKSDDSGSVSTLLDGYGHTILKRVPLLRYYTVFNLEQTEGSEAPRTEAAAPTFNPIDAAEAVISSMPNRPAIRHGGGQAYCNSREDLVGCPVRSAFTSPEAYCETIFHELDHGSGHSSRLARPAIAEAAPEQEAVEPLTLAA